MRERFWDKRIPSIVGILLIVVGVGVTSFLVQKGVIVVGRASPTQAPSHIRISDVSSKSFTLSYTTEEAITGAVAYAQTQAPLDNTALDDRDKQSGSPASFFLHYITVGSLRPSTKYYFSIVSGQSTYLNNEKPFEVTTAPTQTGLSLPQSARGSVLFPNPTIPHEAIVFLKTDSSQTISALASEDGTYSLSLDNLLDQSLSSRIAVSSQAPYTLLIVGKDTESHAIVSSSGLLAIPPIILSKDYNFTTSAALAPETVSTEGFPSLDRGPQNKTPAILVPKKNQGFTDLQPQFTGTTAPNEPVEITIRSEIIQSTVTADKNGNWKFRPSKPLAAGTHTITIKTKDAVGIVRTITQSFVVYALGSQVSQSATPSATPIITLAPILPTATQFPTPTLRATPTLTPSPTVAFAPSPSPTLFPSPTLQPTPTLIAALPTAVPTNPPPLQPGNSSAQVLAVAAFATTIVGVLLFLLTHGKIPL